MSFFLQEKDSKCNIRQSQYVQLYLKQTQTKNYCSNKKYKAKREGRKEKFTKSDGLNIIFNY